MPRIIAVTDFDKMPSSCGDCVIFAFQASDYGECPLTGETLCGEEIDDERPISCPLKEEA